MLAKTLDNPLFQRAMVFLVVEFPDSSKSTGTGFNVLPSGLVVTNPDP